MVVQVHVKSLFTNVPCEGAMKVLENVLETVEDSSLPLPRADYRVAVEMCVKFGALQFNGEEYQQHSGLAMGSPLSPLLACLYMESLEKRFYMQIVGSHSTWLRYVDDVLLVTNKRCDLDEILNNLNAVEPRIQFTVEKEEDQKLAFLDTMMHRTNHGVTFSVYRKPTNKDDFIHYFSGHSLRVKTGTVIGFYLRAYRTCSTEHLEGELEHITNAFKRLAYPESLLVKLREKALIISNRPSQQKEERTRTIILPSSPALRYVERTLAKYGVSTTTPTGKTIRDLVNVPPSNRTSIGEGTIYQIPCATCSSSYIGETGRGMQIRLREHKRDVTCDNTSNALVQHLRKTGHYPNWPKTRSLQMSMDRTRRRALEAAYIQTEPNALNTSPGFFIWAQAAAKLALNLPQRD